MLNFDLLPEDKKKKPKKADDKIKFDFKKAFNRLAKTMEDRKGKKRKYKMPFIRNKKLTISPPKV